MKKIIIPAILILWGVTIIGALFFFSKGINCDFNSLVEDASKARREALTGLPLFSDYITPAKARKMRRFLLQDHLKVAGDLQLKPVASPDEAKKLCSAGKLVKIEKERSSHFYFYNVPRKNRMLHPRAARGLTSLGTEFQKILKEYGFSKRVKFAVSSALRDRAYQDELSLRNRNAVALSSHSFGISFDIFYDSFFVDIPLPGYGYFTDKKALVRLKSRLGFLLGESLRRQFKAILAETLIRMQDRGELYIIHEKRQRCYHVTIIRDL